MLTASVKWRVAFVCKVISQLVVFVRDSDENVAGLNEDLFSPNLGYNIFSPNADFDGDSWNHLGRPNRVMTAFNGVGRFSTRETCWLAQYIVEERISMLPICPRLCPRNPPVSRG